MPETSQNSARGSQLISMLKAGSGILVSRLTGLLRSIAFAGYWGASGIAQAAYNTAFAFPNSLRMLFGEGAFSAAFVPFLTEHLVKDDDDGARKLAERVISIQIIALTGLILLMSGLAVLLYCTRLWNMTPQTRLTLLILPILMPYALLICVAGAFGAILNSLKIFMLPSIVTVLYNAVQIITIFFLAFAYPDNEELAPLLIFCGGALLSGMLHLLILMIACRKRGFAFHFHPTWSDPEVRLLCKKMLPGLLGSGVMQVNSLIDRGLGLILGPLAIGALSFSQNLVYMPVGIFGVAMGTVCLPVMSRAWLSQDREEMCNSLNFALRQLLFMSLPCAAAMLVLSHQIIRVLFQRGAFSANATAATAWTLGFYLIGLPAFCLAKVATNPFHARKDTTTPVKISLCCVALNLCLNIILMQFLRQAGLALATSLCSWINVLTLLFINRKFLTEWSFRPLIRSVCKLLAAAAIAALAVSAGLHCLLRFMLRTSVNTDSLTFNLIVIIAGLAGGGIIYLVACRCLGCPEITELITIAKKRSKRATA